MNGLKWLSITACLLGIILIIYGWTQTWDFEASFEEYGTLLVQRTVKSSVSIVGGLILLVLGMSLHIVKAYFLKVENDLYEMERRRK
ncbi:hypothetical protein [Jeotgalibacillus haloalkalitolerans]|uniref:Uncharacterized protein n=1 Tax=Jeotgalibacillus haloalkalitolerans TaxID=3104292 RepID=A0ABU5KHE0_9BACL|nr:hypothetical protein [Jeotgalibacillus sp. HH7-29]MDZ5710659.1 hypothetical protein [Jeotgalibacillus sp. HH7-29]